MTLSVTKLEINPFIFRMSHQIPSNPPLLVQRNISYQAEKYPRIPGHEVPELSYTRGPSLAAMMGLDLGGVL
jgi:hypothetical protein